LAPFGTVFGYFWLKKSGNPASNSSRSEGVWLEWRTRRVDGLKLVNYTRIENAHEVRTKIFVFYYVAVICTITKYKEPIQSCVSHYDQSAWTASWWRSSKRSTYCKHRCVAVLAQKNEAGNQWCIIKSACQNRTVLKFHSENQLKVH